MSSKVAIVIPVHNALPYLQRTVNQIYTTTSADVPLVLIDDASLEPTADWIQSLVHKKSSNQVPLKHLLTRKAVSARNTRQQLFTRTSNRGLRLAYKNFSPDYIALINSDCDLRAGWLEGLLEWMAPDVGLVGYRDAPPPEELYDETEEKQSPDYVTGHCVLLRVVALRECGVFCETDINGSKDPGLFNLCGLAHIGSDRHLNYAFQAKGWRTLYSNRPGVYHEAGKSWKGGSHNLGWLSQFQLSPLWEPCDVLDEPKWY